MAGYFSDLIGRRRLRHWERMADAVDTLDGKRLRALKAEARALARQADRILRSAENRLAANLAAPPAVRRPIQSDWGWRPEPWRQAVPGAAGAGTASGTPIGGEVKLFHDCPQGELALRQIRNVRSDDVAPYGLRLEVFGFAGSFLSFAIDLPASASDDLSPRHIFRIDLHAESERPLPAFGRLNLRKGANLRRHVTALSGERGVLSGEIDLNAEGDEEGGADHIWMDLIFESPEMNAISLRDVTVTRRPRAEF